MREQFYSRDLQKHILVCFEMLPFLRPCFVTKLMIYRSKNRNKIVLNSEKYITQYFPYFYVFTFHVFTSNCVAFLLLKMQSHLQLFSNFLRINPVVKMGMNKPEKELFSCCKNCDCTVCLVTC